MKIGPRLWKTGLAVALTIFLVRLTGHPYEVYGALAAAVAVAPSTTRSKRAVVTTISVNLLGGLVGSLAVMLLGPHPLVIGAVVVGVLWLCQQLNWNTAGTAAITVTLFVMAPHADGTVAYALWRLLSVVTGSVVGTMVNTLVMPPDYWPGVLAAAARAGGELDTLLLLVAGRLPEPTRLTKPEMLAGVARVEEQIAEARRLADLTLESGASDRPRREVLTRAIKVLGSLLERIQIVHKAALVAQHVSGYQEAVPELQAAVQQLVRWRGLLYQRLTDPQGAAGTDWDALEADLLAMEQRFDAPPGLPASEADAEAFFRLYRVRFSLAYMADRLARLHVAMNAGLPASEVQPAQPGSRHRRTPATT